ncbi:MAG: helix-turn-helix domain-containing protein [Pseudomonadota bacterium]
MNANMHSNSAKAVDRPLRLVFVVYPEIALLDLAGPLQVFAWAQRPGADARGYSIAIVSRRGGRVQTDSLVSIDTDPIESLRDERIDTLMVVGGDGVYKAAEDGWFVDRIAGLAAISDRVSSVCSGAYLLAVAGLLDERRAVTHWQDAEILSSRFPRVRLEIDPIFVRDGHIWTSAGVTAGTDMALAIVAEDLGHEAALDRAQALVTYMVRPGGQSQFSPALERQRADRSGRFERLHAWIAENLARELRVEDLASRENMSLRSFHRLYLGTMGMTPARAVEAIRLEAARDALESTGASLKTIAARCGFGDEGRMRRTFTRTLGISPSAYRERFQLLPGR